MKNTVKVGSGGMIPGYIKIPSGLQTFLELEIKYKHTQAARRSIKPTFMFNIRKRG
jgi:hypothetical protein